MYRSVALALVLSACGLGEPGGFSQAEAEAFSRQLANAAGNSVNSVSGRSAAVLSVQGTGVLVNVNFSNRVNCTAGGRMELSGNWSGSINETGSGILLLEAHQTISDWACIGDYVINGDPYITLTGSFSFFNGQLSSAGTMHMNGGFKWGTGSAQSCQIRLEFLIYTTGGGLVTGEVCGHEVAVTTS